MNGASFLQTVVSDAYYNRTYFQNLSNAKEIRSIGLFERALRALFWWMPIDSTTTKCIEISLRTLQHALQADAKRSHVEDGTRRELAALDLSIITADPHLYQFKSLIKDCNYLALKSEFPLMVRQIQTLQAELITVQEREQKSNEAMTRSIQQQGKENNELKERVKSLEIQLEAKENRKQGLLREKDEVSNKIEAQTSALENFQRRQLETEKQIKAAQEELARIEKDQKGNDQQLGQKQATHEKAQGKESHPEKHSEDSHIKKLNTEIELHKKQSKQQQDEIERHRKEVEAHIRKKAEIEREQHQLQAELERTKAELEVHKQQQKAGQAASSVFSTPVKTKASDAHAATAVSPVLLQTPARPEDEQKLDAASPASSPSLASSPSMVRSPSPMAGDSEAEFKELVDRAENYTKIDRFRVGDTAAKVILIGFSPAINQADLKMLGFLKQTLNLKPNHDFVVYPQNWHDDVKKALKSYFGITGKRFKAHYQSDPKITEQQKNIANYLENMAVVKTQLVGFGKLDGSKDLSLQEIHEKAVQFSVEIKASKDKQYELLKGTWKKACEAYERMKKNDGSHFIYEFAWANMGTIVSKLKCDDKTQRVVVFVNQISLAKALKVEEGDTKEKIARFKGESYSAYLPKQEIFWMSGDIHRQTLPAEKAAT